MSALMTQADIDDPSRRDGICRYHCLIFGVKERAVRRRELITLLSGLAVLPFAAACAAARRRP